ncbi:MAG: hypothetical protein J7M21_00590 [Planctomycetes bacterium]|nr:hypothetical protein [Planctomycetota bacterium]
MTRRITIAGRLMTAAAVALVAAPAGAQSRNAVGLSTPKLRRIGQGTSVYLFNEYSYGLGALKRGGSNRYGQGALRSNISRVNRFSLNRINPSMPPTGLPGSIRTGNLMIRRNPSGLGVASGTTVGGSGLGITSPITANPIPPPAATGRALSGEPMANVGMTVRDNTSIGTVLAQQDDTAFGAARAYLRALEEASTSILRDQSAPITTLVPKPPSQYRDYMLKGDRAFRAGNYHTAYLNFEIANDIGDRDPESFICLAQTQFALSHYSYAKACYFLEQALKAMPELPLANLRPRGFFGNSNMYAEHLVALEDHIRRNPGDGEALLMLAYFRWFDDVRDVEATRRALARALAAGLRNNDTHLVEAVETFWDGMVASGKVHGKLKPAGPVEPADSPAGAPPARAAAAGTN